MGPAHKAGPLVFEAPLTTLVEPNRGGFNPQAPSGFGYALGDQV